ncbi:PQQ-binding-like beta-propeller repeat protein [Roseimaritima ulvae]|uniref:Outer membrane biogenesis protein BamB n=1 Tax=Roseimaritima ulvae TaxID=980254 RepID=A0A5B9QKT7_9BACT|nr:PQQ-binding-like beta-propeller repeat protein [Roseimaritima ulvae]QEG38165.1 outer membrane biogenesis protein BamB [Roseimaritima ulvae]
MKKTPSPTSSLFAVAWLLGASTWSGSCLAADEVTWPGFLGPQRDGWVEHFQPPAEWPKSLDKLWQVEVGSGYGSPLVANDRVYQHAREGDNEVLRCLELATGKPIWKQTHAVPFQASSGGERHGNGPKSSPILADGRIFTLSSLGEISAWDAESGKLLWRRDYRKRFPQNHPNWGASTSPIVDGDRLVAHVGNDDEGALIALDVNTGEEIWSQGNDGAAYSSPLAVEIHGVRQIVDWNHRALVGVDRESGVALWEFPFAQYTSNQNMPTPTFHNGQIILGGENRGIYCLQPELRDGKWSVKERWFQKDVALDMSTAVINADLLFGFSHYKKGQLFCLDTANGEVLWRGPGRTGDNVAFLSIREHVVALLDKGQLQVIEATDGGLEEVAHYQVADSPTWAPPVLLTNAILIKDRTSLTLWSLE